MEYIHEYDEDGYEYSDGVAIPYTSHSSDTHYAVAGGGYTMTNLDGSEDGFNGIGSSSWAIDGTDLSVYNENDIDGLIGLLEALRGQIQTDKAADDDK